MNENGDGHDLDLRVATGQQINDAMARGVFAALRHHKELGRPIVVWNDGRIVRIPPEEIVVPDAGESRKGISDGTPGRPE